MAERRTKVIVRVVTAGSTALIVIASGSPAMSAHDHSDQKMKAFTQEGTCVEALVNVSVETARLDPYVPDEFTISETVPGRAGISVWSAHCEVSVDGGPRVAGFAGGVFTGVGGMPCHGQLSTYSLSWVTSSREIFRHWRPLDHGELVEGATFDYSHVTGVVGEARGRVPEGTSPFALRADVVEGEPDDTLGAPGTPCHWTGGRHGLIRGTYPHDFHMFGSGWGEVRAAPGSPLAKVMGGERRTGEVLFSRFDYQGVVELWG